MQSPLWKQPLERSLYKTKNKPESRFMQLATSGLDGSPQCRTVVFRGYSNMHQLRFITDSRSDKWLELTQNPKVSICWYFTDTREQYRFSGEALLTSDLEEKTQQWQTLSQSGKKQFLWGTPKSVRQDSYSIAVDDNNIPQLPPKHFAVVDVNVESLDYLTLRGDPQNRILYRQNEQGHWLQNRVIP